MGDCEYAVKYCGSHHACAAMCSYMYSNDSAVLLYLFLHIWMTVHVRGCRHRMTMHVFVMHAFACTVICMLIYKCVYIYI